MVKSFLLNDSRMKNTVEGIVFIVLVATIAHILFSHLGLNPTDDGWVLAGSRRIIEGQIPHRDFISIRPTFSFFLHTPFVLIGGDYIFLISRYFVWGQLTTIAWIWTVIISRSFKVFSTLIEKFALALIVFIFSIHYFPILAWYTIDGIFLTSAGIILVDNYSRTVKLVGYLLIGTAPLCKQVFLPMIPISIIVFTDWRQIVSWIMSSLPILLYGTYLAIYGALNDAILQITSRSDLISIGVVQYFSSSSFLLGILFGFLIQYMLVSAKFRQRTDTKILQRFFGTSIIFGIIIGASWTLARGNVFGYDLLFHLATSFGIFGAVTGALIYFITREQRLTSYLRSGLLTVSIAWCTSLSTGYNTPALAIGPLMLFLMASVRFSLKLEHEDKILNVKNSLSQWILSPKNLPKLFNFLVIISVISSFLAFGIVRQNNIYREQQATQLTYDLGDVLPGAKGIKTNYNTYSFLADLQIAKNIAKEEGKQYCIIPEIPVNWVDDTQSNPLSSDRPKDAELRSKELLDRVIADLEENRGAIIVIVQKYEARYLDEGFVPLSDEYTIVNYVRTNFDKIGETQYFELYE